MRNYLITFGLLACSLSLGAFKPVPVIAIDEGEVMVTSDQVLAAYESLVRQVNDKAEKITVNTDGSVTIKEPRKPFNATLHSYASITTTSPRGTSNNAVCNDFGFETTVERKKGYTSPDTTNFGQLSSRYAGDPSRVYARYLYSKSRDYSFGFTIEKDPGEQITWEPNSSRYGLDYYSFHAMVENRWFFKKIIIGDFGMDYGQGLVFGSGMRIGKGLEPVTTIRRNNMGLRPY